MTERFFNNDPLDYSEMESILSFIDKRIDASYNPFYEKKKAVIDNGTFRIIINMTDDLIDINTHYKWHKARKTMSYNINNVYDNIIKVIEQSFSLIGHDIICNKKDSDVNDFLISLPCNINFSHNKIDIEYDHDTKQIIAVSSINDSIKLKGNYKYFSDNLYNTIKYDMQVFEVFSEKYLYLNLNVSLMKYNLL